MVAADELAAFNDDDPGYNPKQRGVSGGGGGDDDEEDDFRNDAAATGDEGDFDEGDFDDYEDGEYFEEEDEGEVTDSSSFDSFDDGDGDDGGDDDGDGDSGGVGEDLGDRAAGGGSEVAVTNTRERSRAAMVRAAVDAADDAYRGEMDQSSDEDDEDGLYLTDDEAPVLTAKQARGATVKSCRYLQTCVKVADCPPPKYPEIAVIGRSNVGKSSLINMLTNRKGVAKTSKNPGKTQTINHFEVVP
jgi:GTP-binding protein